MSHTLGLELQAVVSHKMWVLGVELRSSAFPSLSNASLLWWSVLSTLFLSMSVLPLTLVIHARLTSSPALEIFLS